MVEGLTLWLNRTDPATRTRVLQYHDSAPKPVRESGGDSRPPPPQDECRRPASETRISLANVIGASGSRGERAVGDVRWLRPPRGASIEKDVYQKAGRPARSGMGAQGAASPIRP